MSTRVEYRIAYRTHLGEQVEHRWHDSDLEHLQECVDQLLRNSQCADAWVEQRFVTTTGTVWRRVEQGAPLPKASTTTEQPYGLDMTHLAGSDRLLVAVDDLVAMLRHRAGEWVSNAALAVELRQIADSIDLAAIAYASTRPEHDEAA